MSVENSEETDLWPLNFDMLLVLRFEDVKDDGHAVLVVVSDDSLIRVGGVRLDDATLLRTRLCGLVVLQLDRLRVQGRRVLTKEKCLNFNELNI